MDEEKKKVYAALRRGDFFEPSWSIMIKEGDQEWKIFIWESGDWPTTEQTVYALNKVVEETNV
jgi:hypothetical protein